MNHIFDMKISPYTGTAHVLLDGQALSSQSQLRICAIEHISKWYKDLPNLLYSELNDEYSLTVHCLEIEYIMLTAVLMVRDECLNITHIPISRKYSTKTRCQWLNEAADSMGMKLPDIPAFSLLSTSAAVEYRRSIFNELDSFTKNKCTNQREQINIIITTKREYIESKKYVLSENDIIILIDDTRAEIAVELESCLAIRANKAKARLLIREWIDITVFFPYIMYGHSLLCNTGTPLSFYIRARLQMLAREEPIVESRMSTKMECGHSESILLDEFPTSILTARSSDPTIVEVRNNTITALKPGSVQIEFYSESGHKVCTHALSVYFVPRVTSIILYRVNGSVVLEGEQFQINVKYTPSNAVNISNAKWTVSPVGSLRQIGTNSFEALRSGTSTVTLQVDNISQSFDVQVIALPKDIKMESEIKMKLNAKPMTFHAMLEPPGSGCRALRVRVLDTNVAQWNQGNKTISSVNEGSTVLEVSAIDANGNVVMRKNCRINILPEKDIITPPTLPTIMLVCAILVVITSKTQMSPLTALFGMAISVVEIIQNLNPIIKKVYSRQNVIEVVIGLVCAIGFATAIYYYLKMI